MPHPIDTEAILETDRLVLELTEGATQPLVKLMDTLTRFRIKGIGLAIDDFGVGYSTLSVGSSRRR
jgi:EAL domain-containing protein (putative c-di-GMP-specific phosphodiesterase class I)